MAVDLVGCSELQVLADADSGGVVSLKLFGQELLADSDGRRSEFAVNGRPLPVRSQASERRRLLGNGAGELDAKTLGANPNTLYGEGFINQMTGWGLRLTRLIRSSPHLRQLHVAYHVHREPCQMTCLVNGPGDTPIEARLLVDTFTVPCWNWRFWGDDTRMLYLNHHSTGPQGPGGHCGYDRGPVPMVKGMLENVWRRSYPGVLGLNGAVWYSEKTGQWLASSCRRPQVGYHLDLESSGDGLGYSFTLHEEFRPGQSLLLPEIVFRWGDSLAEMEQYLRDYTTTYKDPMPAWNGHATWCGLNLWKAHTSWDEFWGKAERLVDSGVCNAVGPYNMVHHWSRAFGGTSPMGYEPDPMMGRRDAFERGARKLQERGVPLGTWFSHSGLAPGRDIDEDWFIRGVDGNYAPSWGSHGKPALVHINPGHPGYIAYTKTWLKYYVDLGFRWLFFDCGGWPMPADYTPRDFMRFPGDTGLMSVRFFDEIGAWLHDYCPEAILSLEGAASDLRCHVWSIHSNPVNSPDGLGPRDKLLSWNRLPGQFIAIDQAPPYCPASGRCSLPEPPAGLGHEAYFDWLCNSEMAKQVCAFVQEHSIYEAVHLPGDYSVLAGHVFFPAYSRLEKLVLPEEFACRALAHPVTGEIIQPDAEGAFVAPEPGMYRLLD